jgi:hypothetical protein
MKVRHNILIGLGFAVLLCYAAYATLRIHDLDVRVRAADVRLRAVDTTLFGTSAIKTRPADQSSSVEGPLVERVRRLEEEIKPKTRLLSAADK